MDIAEPFKKSPWGVLTTLLFLLAILAYGLTAQGSSMPLVVKLPAILAVATALVWFAYAFTGDVIECRNEQVRFAYFFVIAAFAVLFMPPFLKGQPVGSEPLGIVSGCVSDSDIGELRCQPLQKNGENPTTTKAHNQWLVNIGGALTTQPPCTEGADCERDAHARNSITGGLVVPLPIFIIALFGAAISLSRRVPEIQKQSDGAYIGTPNQPALTMTEAREYLAFQIMQFISAPLIAIVAHQVVRPENTASAIALAFMAGFGSESILLMIRGVANGIQPKTTANATAERFGTVKGVITAQGKPVAAEVIVRGTTLKTRSDAQGRYTIAQVPSGIQLLSVFKDNTLQARDVSVVPGAQTTCDIDIAGNGHAMAPGLLSGAAPDMDAAAIDDPVTVAIRVAVEMDALDPGTLGMEVDGQAIPVDSHGMVELALLPDMPHRIVASATRGGVAVTGELNITVGLDDEGHSYSLDLQ